MNPLSQISSIYESKLSIPVSKPSPQFILCPIGLVGAGKTTVIKPLAKALSLVRISGDEVRKILKENGHSYDSTFDIVMALVIKYVDLGYSIAIDSDCISQKTRDAIKRAEEKYHTPVVWVHANPPEQFIINKFKNHVQPTWLFKDADEAIKNYTDRKPLHQNIDIKFDYVFDTSKSNLPDQIKEAIEVIKTKLSL